MMNSVGRMMGAAQAAAKCIQLDWPVMATYP